MELQKGQQAVEALLASLFGKALLPVPKSGWRDLDLLEALCHPLREVNENVIEWASRPDGGGT
jgi:hypothetical protein